MKEKQDFLKEEHRNSAKKRYKKREWWKRCKDITRKIFKREEEERQGKK